MISTIDSSGTVRMVISSSWRSRSNGRFSTRDERGRHLLLGVLLAGGRGLTQLAEAAAGLLEVLHQLRGDQGDHLGTGGVSVTQQAERPRAGSRCPAPSMGWGHQDLATVASKIVTLGQPAQSTTIGQLQALLDAFTAVTTTGGCTCRCRTRATPATVYAARPKAAPGDWAAGTHDRVRTDRVDTDGKLTLRVNGRLRHIGIGRTVAPMLIHDLHIRVINAATGELLRELKLGPGLQPTGEPPGPEPKRPRP